MYVLRFNELMYDWRYVCVCMCMSVLCLRGGCIFSVTFPALAFSYLLISSRLFQGFRRTLWRNSSRIKQHTFPINPYCKFRSLSANLCVNFERQK